MDIEKEEEELIETMDMDSIIEEDLLIIMEDIISQDKDTDIEEVEVDTEVDLDKEEDIKHVCI